jgi:hypothetical protein
MRGRHGRDRMVVGFTTTYAISAYHHWCCEFESRSGWGLQHYVIKFVKVTCGRSVVFSTNKSDCHEILLKVALNTIKQTTLIIFYLHWICSIFRYLSNNFLNHNLNDGLVVVLNVNNLNDNFISEWITDCCLILSQLINEQFFSYKNLNLWFDPTELNLRFTVLDGNTLTRTSLTCFTIVIITIRSDILQITDRL